jgi:nicotinate-nucleotide adenylyltransferase
MAHLVCAVEAYEQLGLDVVALVPTAVPPHKEAPEDPGAEHRAAMCELAVGQDKRLRVSRVELERGGASYTVDTLRTLHDRNPENELTFIVGGDMAHSLPTWREPEEILRLARVAVAERAEVRRADIAERLADLDGADRIAFFGMPRIDISSSEIRRRAAAGRSIRYFVPDAVAEYVSEQGLYR